MFILLYHLKGGIPMSDVWGMSVKDRKWFIQRLNEQYAHEKEEVDNATKKK